MTALQLFAYIGAATLLQLFMGTAFALWHSKSRRLSDTQSLQRPDRAAAWKGTRDFRIAERVFEDAAHTQCSFALIPVDGEPLAPFKPGQFLTFYLPVVGLDSPVRVTRCYSLSDMPNQAQYRITVKKALPPPARSDLPEGLASSWLHNQCPVGTVLQVGAPAGQFTLSSEAMPPAVFIAGGIGITPILSMLKTCLTAQADRVTHLLYGVRNSQDQAFSNALEQLVQRHPGFSLHRIFAEPDTADQVGRDYDHAGFITVDLLKAILPHGRHAFYVCGPDPMMKALIPALLDWGVGHADIHRESFGPQTASPKPFTEEGSGPVLAIGFRSSGRTLDWTGQDANLLDFAERHSIPVDSGCRSGSCGTCQTPLVSGKVSYATPTEFDIAPDCCLLCVGIPVTALELDA